MRPESIDRIELPASSLAARNGIRAGYGLFNHTKNFNGFIFHGHTGLVEGFGAEMFYLPDAGIGYAFMINSSSGAPFYQIGKLIRAFVTRDLPKPVLPPAAPAGTAEASSWGGYYEPQNPPIEYLRVINRLMGVMRVKVEGGQLLVKPMLGGTGQRLVMHAERQFRPVNSPLADTLFTRDESGARLMVINQGSIFRELPGWQAWGRVFLGTLCPLLVVSPLLLGLWWIPRRLLSRESKSLHIGMGIWPALAALSFTGMLALNSITSETAPRLAYFSPYSAGLFVLSLILPAASLLGLVVSIRAAGNCMRRSLWLYSLVCSLSACFVTVYLGFHGFIGIRTWRL